MIKIQIRNRTYDVTPSFALIEDIEAECGNCIDILKRLQSGKWSITEIVHLAHIAVSHTGSQVDYKKMGDAVVEQGAASILEPVVKILSGAVFGKDV